MDVVTHGITGVLVSRALPSGHNASVMAAGLIGALAPDLDAVARFWDPMATITVHRAATHSLIGGLAVALVVAGSVWGLYRENFFRLFCVAYLGLLSHIGMDLLTSFGTAFLWPLSGRRFGLSLHYVVEPIITTLALLFLFASFRLRGRRISLALSGFIGIGLYVLVAAAHQSIAFSRWQGFIETQGIRPVRSTVIPLFPGPFRWLGVAETEKAFYQKRFWVYGSAIGPTHLFSKTKNEEIASVQQLREVKLFLDFARFPWRRVRTEGSFRIVEYRDLAFADHPLGFLGGPLSLQIWVDESGSVKKVELGHLF